MDFKSLNVEKWGKTSPTNGPKFNRLSQQTNHLLLKGTRQTPYNSIKNWD